MAKKFNDVEELFIREVLSQHGQDLCDLLADEIEEKNLIDTEDLINSLNYEVKMRGQNPVLSISFFSYGRAIEIQYHKKSSNSLLLQQKQLNNQLWGIKTKNKPRKKRKDTNWYSRTVYGRQNHLISRLSYDLTDREMSRLKNIIEQQKIRNNELKG